MRKALENILETYSHLIGEERKLLSIASQAGDEVTVALMSDYLKEQENGLDADRLTATSKPSWHIKSKETQFTVIVSLFFFTTSEWIHIYFITISSVKSQPPSIPLDKA